MKTYEAHIVTQQLEIKANSIDEAEAKYNGWFRNEQCPDCGTGLTGCGCVEEYEDIYHEMKEMN